MTTLVCGRCRAFKLVDAIPYTAEAVFEAARAAGWSVVGRLTICPACAAKEAR